MYVSYVICMIHIIVLYIYMYAWYIYVYVCYDIFMRVYVYMCVRVPVCVSKRESQIVLLYQNPVGILFQCCVRQHSIYLANTPLLWRPAAYSVYINM